MPTKDNELTEKEKTWIRKLRGLLNHKPKDIELVLTYSGIEVYPIGTYDKHIGSPDDSFGIRANELTTIKCQIVPYSEGS